MPVPCAAVLNQRPQTHGNDCFLSKSSLALENDYGDSQAAGWIGSEKLQIRTLLPQSPETSRIRHLMLRPDSALETLDFLNKRCSAPVAGANAFNADSTVARLPTLSRCVPVSYIERTSEL